MSSDHVQYNGKHCRATFDRDGDKWKVQIAEPFEGSAICDSYDSACGFVQGIEFVMMTVTEDLPGFVERYAAGVARGVIVSSVNDGVTTILDEAERTLAGLRRALTGDNESGDGG